MVDAGGCLCDRPALNRQNDVALALTANGDDACPVDDALAASAAHRGAGDLASLGIRLFDGYVLGVEVDEAMSHPFQPDIGIMPAEVAVTGIKVDADGGRIH